MARISPQRSLYGKKETFFPLLGKGLPADGQSASTSAVSARGHRQGRQGKAQCLGPAPALKPVRHMAACLAWSLPALGKLRQRRGFASGPRAAGGTRIRQPGGAPMRAGLLCRPSGRLGLGMQSGASWPCHAAPQKRRTTVAPARACRSRAPWRTAGRCRRGWRDRPRRRPDRWQWRLCAGARALRGASESS